MLRDKNLVPLSRQHQHALALCVRINRAGPSSPTELEAWQSEIQQHYEQEIQYHFDAEEAHLFPEADKFPELSELVEQLRDEHKRLRRDFAEATARSLDAQRVRDFAELLSTHIRKEERELFEGMQNKMAPEELGRIGHGLNEVLGQVPEACIVPTEFVLRQAKQD